MGFRLLQLFFLLVFIAASVYLVARGPGVGSETEPVTVVIEEGIGAQAIAQKLKDEKLIRSTSVFRLFLFVKGEAANLKPGSYTIARTSGVSEIIDQLVGGKSEDIQVLLVEGWNNRQIAEQLAKSNVIDAEAFLTAARTTDSRTLLPGKAYDFLKDKPTGVDLEGYLFPDTYRFKPGSTAAEVVEKMLDTFDSRVTTELRQRIVASGHTLHEALTLASIVELEVPSTEHRRRVADLFWRRLSIGQPLQSDATVNYITGKGRVSPSIDDTQVDSIYNTYRHNGLPPGPIGNPSLDALEAVANPLANDAFYFLTDPAGNVHYARTFEEHLANKARYLR